VNDFTGDKLNITISANPPLSSTICVGETITLTCHVNNQNNVRVKQYQWSVDEDVPTIGSQTYTMKIPSQSVINVTCGVYAYVTNNNMVFGSNNVILYPAGQ